MQDDGFDDDEMQDDVAPDALPLSPEELPSEGLALDEDVRA
jgi:hypothetical protein